MIQSRGNYLSAPAALLLLAFPAVGAASWDGGYGANLTVAYDDNFRLEPEDEIETSITTLGVFGNTRKETETSRIEFTLGADASSYDDSSIEDESAYELSMVSENRGERITGTLDAGFRSELITSTERLDTGFVDDDGNRDTISVAPGASYRVNERNTVSGRLGFEDVSYDTVSLTDYRDTSLLLSWQHLLDEISSLSLGAIAAVYDPDDGEETDTYTLFAGYEWRSEASTTYNLRIGYTEVERDNETDDGGAFTFTVDHVIDDNRLNMSISNTFEPSGVGEVRETTRLTVQWIRSLTERSQMTLSADGFSTDERDYYAVAAGYTYSYTPDISLAASYRYQEQDEDGIGSADSSYLAFSIYYSPN